MKIGVIGSGRIGGLIGTLWAQAGHEVLFSSRHPEELAQLVQQAGSSAGAGLPDQAAAFGDAILLSIPFVALPEFGRTMARALERKVVLETANPFPGRDGEMATDVIRSGRGTGTYLRDWFPGVRIVRAFNSVWDGTLALEAHRPEPRVGIPLASDDDEALQVAAGLVVDAGFDPVIVGLLNRSREFDVGTAVYNTGMSGVRVRETMGLPSA